MRVLLNRGNLHTSQSESLSVKQCRFIFLTFNFHRRRANGFVNGIRSSRKANIAREIYANVTGTTDAKQVIDASGAHHHVPINAAISTRQWIHQQHIFSCALQPRLAIVEAAVENQSTRHAERP
jgi:hypothetical protein